MDVRSLLIFATLVQVLTLPFEVLLEWLVVSYYAAQKVIHNPDRNPNTNHIPIPIPIPVPNPNPNSTRTRTLIP